MKSISAPRIAMNARFLSQTVTGVQRYAVELHDRLREKVEAIVPSPAWSGSRGHVWEQVVLPFQVGGRCLWSPGNTGPLTIERQVVTIHDAATLDHPEWFDTKFALWYRALLPKLIRRVRRVLTVSEFSRQRLLEHTGVSPDKIIAVPNGVDARFGPIEPEHVAAMRTHLSLPNNYVLALGSLEPRKNLGRLFQAWENVARQLDGVELVVAGSTAHTFRDLGFARVPPRVRMLGYVPEEHLRALYNGALAFVYPSLYEGFGLPPLEAMACGTPVLTSDKTALPEVVGSAALLVDPFDVESIACGIQRIVDDETLRRTLSQAGLQRAKGYHWERTADLTWAVLLDVANE